MKDIKSIFFNKKILIYGLAQSGLTTLKFLKKFKSNIYCWDDNVVIRKKIKKKNLFKYEKNSSNYFFDFIVLSPGINIRKCYLSKFLEKNREKIITDLDIFCYFNKNRHVISVTGTNGKSTTCKMLEKVFENAGYKTQLLGNIGNPILSFKKPKNNTIFIVEVSSYQLEYTKYFKSNHALILNISSDHLERHGNMKNYIDAKTKILKFQSHKDHFYLNSQNKYTKGIKNNIRKNNINSQIHLVEKKRKKSFLKKIKNKYLLSHSNLENISFVIEIAKNYKIRKKTIFKALNKFKGLPHRQEKFLLNNKITCINDSKATNFVSSLQSLKSYKNIFWILGGIYKTGDNFLLNKVKKNIIKAYIIGKNSNYFKKQLKNRIDFVVACNLKSAFQKILNDLNQINKINNIKKNKYTILFSPAAASFDQFKNFADRGNQFKKLIYKERSNI